MDNEFQEDELTKEILGWKAKFIIKAQEFQKQGNLTEALIYIHNALALSPDDTYANVTKVRILFDRKEHEEVIHYLFSLRNKNADLYQSFNGDFWVGLAFQILGDMDGALTFYNNAVNYPWYKEMAWFNLGRICVNLKRFEDAIKFFANAAEAKPGWSTPLYHRALLIYQFDGEEFKDEVIKFVEQFPHHGLEISNLVSMRIRESPLHEDIFPPETLFHYTNIDAVKGVIENRQLWLTRIDFLNDPSERSYSIEVLEYLLNRIVKDIGYNNRDKFENDLDIIKKLLVILDEVVYQGKSISESVSFHYEDLGNNENQGLSMNEFAEIIQKAKDSGFEKYYIFSLTDREDNLPLWSMYCHNHGYNIEFDTHKLLGNLQNLRLADSRLESYHNLQSKVLYKSELVYELFKFYYEIYFANLQDTKTRVTVLLSVAIVGSVFVKNPDFSFENEFRIVVAKSPNPNSPNTDEEVQFRTRNGCLIPYIKGANYGWFFMAN